MSDKDFKIRINLSALQRVDQYTDGIVLTARHVVLYSYKANAWHKIYVEGTLHVYTRSSQPWYGIMIMNRLNTNNFIELVTNGLDIEPKEPFLLFKNNSGSIYCIWFYDVDDFVKICDYLKSLIKIWSVKKSDEDIKQITGKTMLIRTQESYR